MQPPAHPADKLLQERLDSWKAVAAYLKRDVTTVQRWERREGMPVHRHLHDKQGSVYAFRSELDAWVQGRRAGVGAEGESQRQLVGQSGDGAPPAAGEPGARVIPRPAGDSSSPGVPPAASDADASPNPPPVGEVAASASHRVAVSRRWWLPMGLAGALVAVAVVAYW